ncbi:MAG: hypothetical protein BWY73_00708 [candidate division TA06 bacterium ADurb.Bin417]|uniref:Uncharacterized protein n=1 Tax=candidate division TA06 bacterium ADurb.Bin417 TaxID=1852828 RepID=A0A1V5MIA6_UNCT6|nr:MAG: hypothetical protein BWY73_00708 [candidate division TA06 bacterium ADurb.Bin417]
MEAGLATTTGREGTEGLGAEAGCEAEVLRVVVTVVLSLVAPGTRIFCPISIRSDFNPLACFNS